MRARRLAAALLLLGCTSAQPPIRTPECQAGEVSACLCEGARPGWQSCGADGRLGACACADGGAMVTPTPACDEPFARCGGDCVNLLVSDAHCGACGRACPAGQLCLTGGCVLAADASPARPDVVASDASDVIDATDDVVDP